MTAILDLPATQSLAALNRAKSYYAHLCRMARMEWDTYEALCDDPSEVVTNADITRQAIICEGIEERKAEAYEALSETYKDYYVAMGWKTVDGVLVSPH